MNFIMPFTYFDDLVSGLSVIHAVNKATLCPDVPSFSLTRRGPGSGQRALGVTLPLCLEHEKLVLKSFAN